METIVWQYQPGVQPPVLVPLLGKRVTMAWISATGTLLLVRLENGYMLCVSPGEGNEADGAPALEILCGQERPGESWVDLTGRVSQTAHTLELRGRLFTGLDGRVVTFGDVGAMITRQGVSWVRQA